MISILLYCEFLYLKNCLEQDTYVLGIGFSMLMDNNNSHSASIVAKYLLQAGTYLLCDCDNIKMYWLVAETGWAGVQPISRCEDFIWHRQRMLPCGDGRH